MTPERAVPAVVAPLTRHFEAAAGPLLTPQKDPCGFWQIGYGHKLAPTDPLVTGHGRVTLDAAEELLANDLDEAACEIESLVDGRVYQSMLEQEYGALIDFTFNEGAGRLRTSTLLRKLNAFDMVGAAAELLKWVYGQDPITMKEVVLPGLQARRQAEHTLWTQGHWP